MLNLAMGALQESAGHRSIRTTPGLFGHALFGPYEQRGPGRYIVTFKIQPIDLAGWANLGHSDVCVILDVAAENGTQVVARRDLRLSDFNATTNEFVLEFRIWRTASLEYRVCVTGNASFVIDEDRPVTAFQETPLQHHLSYIRSQLDEVEARLSENPYAVDYQGFAPDRYLTQIYHSLPANALYEALCGGSEPIRDSPSLLGLGSGLCRHLHFTVDQYRYWMKKMQIPARFHRKFWEFFYIAQGFYDAGLLRPGAKGLVFAVGTEPLPAVFASFGCSILATDQAPEEAVRSGWADSGQHALAVEGLYNEKICPADPFYSLVRFESMDMNFIPVDQHGLHDFCWSSCSLEHLGSLEHGMRFIQNSLETLRPGGTAIHTTEYNLSSNDDTLETESLSIYRRRDFDVLVERLTAAGHHVAPFDWTLGVGFAETVLDLPPYHSNPHLRLKAAGYDVTSIGIIITKAG